MTERDASESVAGFAVDTFVELVTSEATTGLVEVDADEAGAELVALVEAGAVEAGAELVALVEAGASELTATLDATELVGATDVAVTVSVAGWCYRSSCCTFWCCAWRSCGRNSFTLTCT